MTIYDICLFVAMSPMVWLPIYQVCEFVYRQRKISQDVKIYPIEEEEGEEQQEHGIVTADPEMGIGNEASGGSTNDSPHAGAAGGARGGMVKKLTVSDKILSGETELGQTAGAGERDRSGSEDGKDKEKSDEDGKDQGDEELVVSLELGAEADHEEDELVEV
jgi:hypothetical protein